MATIDPLITAAWDEFLMSIALLNHHYLYHGIEGDIRRNPIVEEVGPRALYVVMGCHLDEGLKTYMTHHSLKVVSPFQKTMGGRIKYLDSLGRLKNGAEIERIRKLRNDLAHTPAAITDWQQLEHDAAHLHQEFMHLGLVDMPQPVFEPFATRSAMYNPGEAGIHHAQDFEFGVCAKTGGRGKGYTHTKKWHGGA